MIDDTVSTPTEGCRRERESRRRIARRTAEGGWPMITRIARGEAEIVPLPGRTWHAYLGPANSEARNVSLGVSVYPPGSKPVGHVHPAEEETIYCAAGRGRIVTPDSVAEVEPGVVVHVPPGTFHATEADGPEPLELVCLFSPPVVSGSYEKGAS
jgi:quercetin dioxygenase-like cupin family protein